MQVLKLIAVVALAVVSAEDPTSERPPVSRAEYEARFGVHCRSVATEAWSVGQALATMVDSGHVGSLDELPAVLAEGRARLLDSLGLCAVVATVSPRHPGEAALWRRAHQVLASWPHGPSWASGEAGEVFCELLYLKEAVD